MFHSRLFFSTKTLLHRMSYHTETTGTFGSLDYRMYLLDPSSQQRVSPWHDVPLFPPLSPAPPGLVVHMVNEIPRDTAEKMEVSRDLPCNPIAHDVDKRGLVRLLRYSALPWNYGMIPRTWEDPAALFADPDDPLSPPLRGDGDPVDVVELGGRVLRRGEVLAVRVVGAFALLDEGELDWKLLAVALDDPLAERVRTLADLLRERPQQVEHVHEWYQNYKTAEGKGANKFGFGGRPQDEQVAAKIIEETHQHWKRKFSS